MLGRWAGELHVVYLGFTRDGHEGVFYRFQDYPSARMGGVLRAGNSRWGEIWKVSDVAFLLFTCLRSSFRAQSQPELNR